MGLLNEHAVLLDVEIKDAIDVIRLSGDLLVKAGLATETYTEAMIEGYKKVGPYIVIAPGIAIPHSRPENGAIKSGFRSEEHTSELQSRFDLVCRLLLEKKKQ